MVVGFVETRSVVGLVEVEFVVVYKPTNAHILTKSASPVETGSSQLY